MKNKVKDLSWLVVLAAVIGLLVCSLPVFADTAGAMQTEGLIFTPITETTCSVSGYIGTSRDVIIPTTVLF